MGQREVFNPELYSIEVTLKMSIARVNMLRAHRIMTLAVFTDWQAAIRCTAHLDPGLVQQQERAINRHASTFHILCC